MAPDSPPAPAPLPHALLRAAVEQTRDAVVVTDGGLAPPGPRILWVNPAFCQLTGYAAHEVLGRTPRLLQGPQTDRTELRRMRACLEAGQPFRGEGVNYRKDGTPYLVEWEVSAVRDGAGGVTHYLSTQRDVTARREAERALAGRATEASGALMAGLAHAVRNPAFALSATLDVLEARFGTREELRRHVRVLRGEVERLTRLTSEVAEYVRPLPLALGPAPLAGVLEEVLGACAGQATERGVRVECTLPPALPALSLDETQLSRALRALVEFAVSRTPRGGRLEVQGGQVAGERVRLALEDEGPPLEEGELPRLFLPFSSHAGLRAGLALALARRIVEEHRGTLHAERGPGGGLRMVLELPVPAALLAR